MTDATLHNCRILVAEDEYMIADEFCMELADAGALILGPVATLADAVGLIAASPEIDGAVLDVSLRGELVFPAADLLVARGVPIVFTTGYDASAMPDRFARAARCEKPVNIGRIVRAIGRAVHPEAVHPGAVAT